MTGKVKAYIESELELMVKNLASCRATELRRAIDNTRWALTGELRVLEHLGLIDEQDSTWAMEQFNSHWYYNPFQDKYSIV